MAQTCWEGPWEAGPSAPCSASAVAGRWAWWGPGVGAGLHPSQPPGLEPGLIGACLYFTEAPRASFTACARSPGLSPGWLWMLSLTGQWATAVQTGRCGAQLEFAWLFGVSVWLMQHGGPHGAGLWFCGGVGHPQAIGMSLLRGRGPALKSSRSPQRQARSPVPS